MYKLNLATNPAPETQNPLRHRQLNLLKTPTDSTDNWRELPGEKQSKPI